MIALQEQFRCLACPSGPCFPSFPLLSSHFLSAHGVPSLLPSPVTRAVLLTSSLGSCTCLLCSEGCQFLGLQDLQEHLGNKHGSFFQERWLEFSSIECRWVIMLC